MDKSSIIFGNPIPNKTIKKANKSKKKYIKAFGDDTNVDYYLKPVPIDTELYLEGQVLEKRSRSVIASSRIILNGTVLASAVGEYFIKKS